jgi:putative ABC transport system ATP-binding protein
MGHNHTQGSWGDIIKPAWRLIELDRRELGYIFGYILALGLISSVVPFASQVVVNQTAFTGAGLPIVVLALVVFGVTMIGVFLKIFQMRVVELLKKRVFVRAGLYAAKNLMQSTGNDSDENDREVANRFFDIITFQNNLATLLSDTLGVVALTFFGIILLAIYHPFLLAFSLIVLAGCAVMIIPLARAGLRTGYEKSAEKYKVAYWLSEMAENRSLLKQGSEHRLVWGITDTFLSKYVVAHMRYLNILLTQSGGLFLVQAIASSAFLGLGGWLVIKGQLNLGQLVAAEIVMLSVLGSLGKFDKYLDSFYDWAVAGIKLNELTQITELDDERPRAFESLLSIKEMHISSPMLASPLTIKAGDAICVRGPTKALRSDFIRGLSGRSTDHPVQVVLGSTDALEVSEMYKQHMCVLLSSPAVFCLPILENLTILSSENHVDHSKEALQTLLQTQLLREFADLESREAVDCQSLSLPARARLATLRCFFSPHPVVLVDYFFNLLELQDQLVFLQAFRKQFPDRILVVNSNDPKLDPHFTQVITLNGGV